MPFLVIDSEGSGLFDFKKPADAEGQPRMAALAMIVIDDAHQIVSERAHFIKPDGWSMSPEATAVNGLTDEFLHERGEPVRGVLEVYSDLIRAGHAVIAFNAQHDCKTVRAELRRAGMDDLFLLTKNVCVMRKANGHILKASGKKGWPSLAEARQFLNLDTSRAHTALGDAHDALAIFRHLHSVGADLTPEVHFAKDRPMPDATQSTEG
jgi:DNA polymerase-3 subunit epsilon